MSHPSKKKGSKFEAECVNLAKSLGLKANRAWGSNGRALGEAETVDIVIEGVRFQCKRRRKFTKEIFPEDTVEGQIIRADRQSCAYVVIPLPVFLTKYLRDYDTRANNKSQEESG